MQRQERLAWATTRRAKLARFMTSARRVCQIITAYSRLCAAGTQEGRHEVSPLLRITPFSFGREQTYRSLPEDLRHLLPQIRARCARKSKSLFPPAAHLLQATRRVDSTPRGRCIFYMVCFNCWRVDSTPRGRCCSLLVGARIARPFPLGWHPFCLLCPSSWAAIGKRHLSLRAQRALQEGGVIRKR